MTSSGATGQQGDAEDGEPEALRGLDPPAHGHLRDRPGGHGKDLPRGRDGGGRAPRAGGGRIILTRPAVEAGERLGSCPATSRPRSIPICARFSTPSTTCSTPIGAAPTSIADHRGRAAGIHAGKDAQRLVRDPRRGAEHEPGADEDVPDPARVRLEDGGHGDITQIDLPRDQRSGLVVVGEILAGSTTSPSCVSAARTSSAISSSSGSSRPTASTSASAEAVDARPPDVPGELRPAAEAPCGRGGRRGALSVELVGGSRIRELNREHRGLDEPTDVLSFPIDGAGPVGRAPRARRRGHLPRVHRRLDRATVHGVLHLCGYDHEADG